LDASSRLERRLLEQWIAGVRPASVTPADVDAIAIPPSRRRRRWAERGRLEALLAVGEDPLLAPLRVAWLPGRHAEGERPATLRDVLLLGDVRDPGRLRQSWLLRRHPDRCQIVVGEPAPLSDLRQRWHHSGGIDVGETTGLADFVVRQATLALERAERGLRGNRYKVPRLVREDILARPAFRGGLARLARRLGRTEQAVTREASRDLRELAAAHSRTMIDIASQLFRFMISRGYGKQLRYDHDALARIAALSQRHPVVFLPTHKSNLDHPVISLVLYENGLPPNHTAGGINMNFFPLGPIFRRAGVFFIRRSFKDDEVYKLVLQHYIDYLIEKRFSLEWYIEGGRSRSGKMLPPRFGLLAYVIDAYRRGKSEDVYLIPVSIAYDQIQDVREYVAESRGGAKQRESFGWFLSIVRRMRRRYGDIHIRFGEPLSLAGALGPADPSAEPAPDERSLEIQKVAFDVCVRVNRVTPITPTSLVTLALLGVGDRALTVDEILRSLQNMVAWVRRRALPTTAELDLHTAAGVQRTLDALVANGVVTCFSEGLEAVYAISPDQHLAAAYYRNTIIHFTVTGAIAELALLRAAEEGVADREAEFLAEALRVRDLLKFEFFFAEREVFLRELTAETASHDPAWQTALRGGPADIHALLRRFQPFSAHRVLRPFLEAYRVVADALARWDAAVPVEDGPFLASCLALGKQYTLQRRIRSPESVSKVLFQTALRLAANRRLVAAGDVAAGERRRAFAAEIALVVRRIDAIEALAAARRSGVSE
jgi:glycerol-3-phosphate O-acyltransferase